MKIENENVGLGYQNGIVFSEGPVLDLAVLERIQKAHSELKLPDGFAPTDAAIRITYELVDSERQEWIDRINQEMLAIFNRLKALGLLVGAIQVNCPHTQSVGYAVGASGDDGQGVSFNHHCVNCGAIT